MQELEAQDGHPVIDLTAYNGGNPALLNFFNARPASMLCADLYSFALRPGLYAPSGATLRYTSSLYAISLGGHVFASGPPNFKRGGLRCEIGLKTSDNSITIESDDSVLLNGIPILARLSRGEWNFATVTVERAYSAGPGQPWLGKAPRFLGILNDVQEIGRISAVLNCKNISYLLDTQWPKGTIMSTCGKILYGTDCTVNPASFTTTGAVQNSPTAPTVNGFCTNLTQADSYYLGGTVTFTSGKLAGLSYWVRSYLNSGGVVRLQTPLLVAPASGDTFKIIPGCDKSQTTCTNRFSNVANFGGFPFVPQPTTAY
jgi:uncharacterized phage protein (TIGR02218 family)